MSQYRVLVSGSRMCNRDAARAAIERQFDALRDYGRSMDVEVVIIHGGARGVDTIAHQEACVRNFTTIAVYPQWDDYTDKRRAALDRNIKMLVDWKPAAVLSFDAGSPGTKHQVAEAERRDIPTRVIPIKR